MFPNVPIAGFRNGKSLKDYLVRASLPILNNTLGREPCGKRNCQVCQFIANTDNFSPITTDETFKINKGPLTVTQIYSSFGIQKMSKSVRRQSSNNISYEVK